MNNLLNASATNVELFGWAGGSLLAVIALVVFGGLRGADRLLGVFILLIVGLHSLYWFSGGPDFGARYWFLIIVPLAVLTVRFINAGIGHRERNLSRIRLASAAAGLTLASLVCFVPWRALDKYHEYRGMRPDVRRMATQEGFDNGLVLVRGPRDPDYASAAVYNPLDVTENRPLYAWFRGSEVREALRSAFPDRPVWVLEGPSLTGDGYRVVERPDSIGR